MIYTDGTHVITDNNLGELHDFAEQIGLRREWFQDRIPEHDGQFMNPHYDTLTQSKRDRAKRAGAIRVSPKVIVLLQKLNFNFPTDVEMLELSDWYQEQRKSGPVKPSLLLSQYYEICEKQRQP